MDELNKMLEQDKRASESVNWDKLKKEASEMTLENLPEFINRLSNLGFSYDGSVKATGLACVATAWALCRKFGLTGFQASCVNWEFLLGWYYTHNVCGMKIVDYDDMLYPQYEYKFDKVIPKHIWDKIQEEANKNLSETDGMVSKDVVAHWKSITDGKIPFGYKIKED